MSWIRRGYLIRRSQRDRQQLPTTHQSDKSKQPNGQSTEFTILIALVYNNVTVLCTHLSPTQLPLSSIVTSQWLSPIFSSLLHSPYTVVGFLIRAPFRSSLLPPTSSSSPQPPFPGTGEDSSSPHFLFLFFSLIVFEIGVFVDVNYYGVLLLCDSSFVWIDRDGSY